MHPCLCWNEKGAPSGETEAGTLNTHDPSSDPSITWEPGTDSTSCAHALKSGNAGPNNARENGAEIRHLARPLSGSAPAIARSMIVTATPSESVHALNRRAARGEHGLRQ